MAFGSIALAIFGIGLLIFLHEGGHFLAARAAGVRVEVFSLGFGPRLAGFRWRGTDFRLSAVPFGGYVMVAGQDPSDRRFKAEQSLWSKSVGQRALFWSGGVLVNAAFALAVFPLVFSAGVRFEAPIAGEVQAGTPAWEAGIERGDRVVEVAGKEVYSFQNMAIEVALSGKREVELLIEKSDGRRQSVVALPKYNRERGLYGLGLLPAYDDSAVTLTVEAGGAAERAGMQTGDRLISINGAANSAAAPLTAIEPLSIVFERDGEERVCSLTPESSTAGARSMIGVRPLPNRIAGIRPGAALAERLGVQRGDVIVAIDGANFLSGDLRAFGASDAEQTTWTVRRGDELLRLAAPCSSSDREALIEALALDTDPRLQVQPLADSAAEAAGLLAGDWLMKVGDAELASWDDLRREVQLQGGGAMQVQVLRPDPTGDPAQHAGPSGQALTVSVTPRVTPVPDVGFSRSIQPLMTEIRANSFADAVQLGAGCSVDLIKQLYVTLKRLITGEVGAKNLGGIIRISQVSYQAAQRGPSWFWYFLALLSVNLAFVNLLPVPVLDGGHLLFLLIERVKGSPVSTKVFGYSQIIGLVFVLLLVIFVTYNDILRLL